MTVRDDATLRRYVVGFLVSLGLTLIAYFATVGDWVTGGLLLGILAVLALSQAAVQMVFFLHLGDESRPRWRLMAFGYMLVALLIVVVGSLWIMKHLDYNMMYMDDEQMSERLERESGF